MAHRKSPRRIEKQRRIQALRTASAPDLARLGAPREALIKLEVDIVGRVVLPGDPAYNQSRQESNPAFQAFPQIIVYCEVAGDVESCLEFAVNNRLPAAIRSGGHSTAGYSVNNGIVIDVGLIDGITINPTAQTATVGPGVDFDRLNAALDPTGLHVPSGACGNVCVGGFMQGGGFGYTSRNFGMNCDLVIEIVVMLWNGATVRANATQNQDLFWALRGGTGGNFGVVLEVTYQLQPLAPVWAFAIQWDVAEAATVLLELQQNYTRGGAPQALGYMMNVGFNGASPVALIQGMFCGTAEAGKQAVASLMAIPTAQLLVDKTGLYGAMDQYLDDEPYLIPNPPAGASEDKIAGYVASPLTLAQWQEIVDQFYRSPSANNVMYTEPYGGAISAYPLQGNAFVHRAVDMNLVIDAFWNTDSEKLAVENWLLQFENLRGTYFSEEAYQNYPRGSYERFRMLYWGVSFDQLLATKKKYDPNNFFRYQQSISPYPEGMEAPAASPAQAPLFPETPIQYERLPRHGPANSPAH
jgi:hypothetical protein